ncbi:MAG: phosphate ABC transporter ATP-binding protein [Verrucomicrobia bacterium]|nr:MAG: phosphate ABC transporter ATP-binding protein [Verrucomicrobiota bacterium]
MTNGQPHIEFRNVSAFYGSKQVLNNISFTIPRYSALGIIGPANSGKTTLLKTINRTLDFVRGARFTGDVLIGGQSVADIRNPNELRRRIGVVFPLPVGLPLSIYENVAYAPRRVGITAKGELDGIVERCLRQAVLWDEVKDRLELLGTRLSGGQQQRLTLARALSLAPEILCLDEFSIAIDPVTTMRIEDVLKELKQKITIILVTNLVQQARRLATRTMFLWNGEIIELDSNEVIFSDQPKDKRTYDYVNGIFG